jgi:antitoxin ParD1/3/4
MATRNVVLTNRQEQLVDALVESGRYQNASEVLREGLRLIEQREAEEAAKLKALREAAKLGRASAAAGNVKSFTDLAALRRYLKDVAFKGVTRVKGG